MIKRFLCVLLYGVICSTANSMDDQVIVPVEQMQKKVIQSDQHEKEMQEIENFEEKFNAESAVCCRISGNIVDVFGSLTGYITAALATASAMPIGDDIKLGLAIAAGIGGLASGVLHNIKPMVDRISKEKEERAKALHDKHKV